MKTRFISSTLAIAFAMTATPVMAEEAEAPAAAAETVEETSSSPFSIGVDIYSSYLWRGSKLAGASIQPSISVSAGGFTAGVWGSVGFTGDAAEVDPYLSYEFPFGLTLGLTDYYYCDKFSDIDSHAIEFNASMAIKKFSIAANYIFNEAENAGSAGSDLYFEAGYEFKYFNIFLGAGNGWHTSDTDFNVCNIGIGSSKDIKITDTFSIPISGQIVFNPDIKRLYFTVGISF